MRIYNVSAGSNTLTSIDLTHQQLLINLTLSGTSITNLDLSNNPNLESLNADNNKIQSIYFGTIMYIRQIYCSNNKLQSLNVNNFINLDTLYCSNNLLTQLELKNGSFESNINFSNNQNLASICCDSNQLVYIQNQCLLNENYSTAVNSNCISNGVLATANSEIDNTIYHIFPNPAQDYFIVAANQSITNLDIFDNNGKCLKSVTLDATNSVSISDLQKGMYFIKFYAPNAITTIKLVKI